MVVWHESHKTVPGNSESGPCTLRIPHSGEFAVFIVFLAPQLGCSTRPFYGRNSTDFRCGEPYRWSQLAVRASYPQEVCRVHGRARFNPSIPTHKTPAQRKIRSYASQTASCLELQDLRRYREGVANRITLIQ